MCSMEYGSKLPASNGVRFMGGGPVDGCVSVAVKESEQEYVIPCDWKNLRYVHVYYRRCKGARVFLYAGIERVDKR